MYRLCINKKNRYNISTVKHFSWLKNMIKNILKSYFNQIFFSDPILAVSNI